MVEFSATKRRESLWFRSFRRLAVRSWSREVNCLSRPRCAWATRLPASGVKGTVSPVERAISDLNPRSIPTELSPSFGMGFGGPSIIRQRYHPEARLMNRHCLSRPSGMASLWKRTDPRTGNRNRVGLVNTTSRLYGMLLRRFLWPLSLGLRASLRKHRSQARRAFSTSASRTLLGTSTFWLWPITSFVISKREWKIPSRASSSIFRIAQFQTPVRVHSHSSNVAFWVLVNRSFNCRWITVLV